MAAVERSQEKPVPAKAGIADFSGSRARQRSSLGESGMSDQGLILVTGATGFVGKWTVLELLKAGHRVRGTVRSLGRSEEVRATLLGELGQGPLDRLELVEADLLDDKGWAEAMRGVATVMHIATAIRADEPKDQSLVIRPALEGTQR